MMAKIIIDINFNNDTHLRGLIAHSIEFDNSTGDLTIYYDMVHKHRETYSNIKSIEVIGFTMEV